MVSAKEAKTLTQEIAELLKTATTEEKIQIKGILIGAKLVSKNDNASEPKAERAG